MSDSSNERRSDNDMRRLYEAIERVGRECSDQHKETQASLMDISRTQTVFDAKLQGVEKTLGRIGEKVDSTAERVAGTESMVNSLRSQNAEQFGQLRELEGELRVVAGRGTEANPVNVAFVQSDNFKWMVGGIIGVFVLVLLAFGAISVSDIKDVTPMGGE